MRVSKIKCSLAIGLALGSSFAFASNDNTYLKATPIMLQQDFGDAIKFDLQYVNAQVMQTELYRENVACFDASPNDLAKCMGLKATRDELYKQAEIELLTQIRDALVSKQKCTNKNKNNHQ